MTSLAATVSFDQRGPSGLYIITDSRITWSTSASRWDSAQKTFASRTSPDIFGYCGDAFFPPALLRQILEQISSGLVSMVGREASERHSLILKLIKHGVNNSCNAPIGPFSIFHGAKDGDFMLSKFKLWEIRFSPATNLWFDDEKEIKGEKSYMLCIDGSGRNAIENSRDTWNETAAKNTTRAAMSAFCDTLNKGSDPRSGGPPQLVGLWRKGLARTFGLIWKGERYLAGLQVPSNSSFVEVAWFNASFERCDGETMKRLDGAKEHMRWQ